MKFIVLTATRSVASRGMTDGSAAPVVQSSMCRNQKRRFRRHPNRRNANNLQNVKKYLWDDHRYFFFMYLELVTKFSSTLSGIPKQEIFLYHYEKPSFSISKPIDKIISAGRFWLAGGAHAHIPADFRYAPTFKLLFIIHYVAL